MRSLILLLTTYLVIGPLAAQHYDLPTKELNKKFLEVYDQTDKTKNFFERLYQANDFFFSLFNDRATLAVGALQKKNKLNIDSAVSIIYDTVMTTFARDHALDEFRGDNEKYLPFLKFYNEKLCPCIGEKFRQSAPRTPEEKDLAECLQKLALDTSYLNGVRRNMGSATMNELFDASKMAMPYMYQHCSDLYNFYSGLMRYMASNYAQQLDRNLSVIDQTVLRQFEAQSPELPKIFPDYKKFETDIKSANAEFRKKGALYLVDRSSTASGQLTVVKTYYGHNNGKLALFGQIVYVLKEQTVGAPMLSFKFTPGDKIKDPNQYLDRMEDVLEPPPMDGTKFDLKIDTTQRKN
jgi:hypothetical protein